MIRIRLLHDSLLQRRFRPQQPAAISAANSANGNANSVWLKRIISKM